MSMTARFVLACAIAALIIVTVIKCGAQPLDRDYVLQTPKKVALQWHFHDEWRVWITAYSYDSDYKTEGYHPSFTYIVSDYRPIVKQLPNGKWQITFTDELSKDLP